MADDVISKQRLDDGIVMVVGGFDAFGDKEWTVVIDLDGENPRHQSFAKYLSAMEYAAGYISGYEKAKKRFGKRRWF